MKKVHDSAMRMPKQTKLMFKNIEKMRKASHHSPSVSLSRRSNTEHHPFEAQIIPDNNQPSQANNRDDQQQQQFG